MTIDPVCFTVGTREIRWYGVMMALGFLAALWHWRLLGRRTRTDTAYAGDLLLWIMLASILGARAAYVAANWDYFRVVPAEIPRVDQGGLIFYGGFIGAALAVVLFARRQHRPLLGTLDLIVTALPLGHAFGRVGCFLNDCCGGRAAPPASLWAFALDRYPVQLYEAALNLALYAFLFWFYLSPARRKPGRIGALYLMIYPAGRFLLEFLRGDDRLRAGALDVAQLVSLALVAAGLVLWGVLRRHEQASRTA